jgi:hypothetical protein|tara:strand:+ start:138 stop:734 length:597 start_codon:yes stop_codon:yes gene_type:complete
MASIEDLKSTINGGGGLAQQNQYMVQMPNVPGTNFTAAERNILCRTTRLPGRQILTAQRDIGLMKQQMGIGYAVSDIAMSFHVLNDYKSKDYFDKWQNQVVDQQTQQIRFANEYKKPVDIYHFKKGQSFQIFDKNFRVFGINFNIDIELGRSAQGIYGVQLLDAFPVTVNGIDLADGSNDATVEVSVSLSYRNWKQIK